MQITQVWCSYTKTQITVLLSCVLSVRSALIPPASRSASVSLHKRAVTYGNTNNPNSKSSVCSDDQKRVLEQTMPEAAKLAAAGSDSLELIQDMLDNWNTRDDSPKYYSLDKKDRLRLRETYFTFFGKIDKPEQISASQERLKFIKDRLDRIKNLYVEGWPESIKFFCDSTYYQDKDQNGETWDMVTPPKDNPARDGREWKYDYDRKIWSEVLKKINCGLAGSDVSAYTWSFRDDLTDRIWDRITFCPQWFNIIKAPDAGPSFTGLNPAIDIKAGTLLKQFTRKAGRVFLHEHLHTYFVNQDTKPSNKLIDADDANSYGPDNARRLGLGDQNKANRNIKNVVSMLYPTWNWATLSAREPSENQPQPNQGQEVGAAVAAIIGGG